MRISEPAVQAKHTATPWDVDTVKNDGDYGGGPDCRSGFDSYCIVDASGKTLFDTLNSDAACVAEGVDDHAYDEVGKANTEFVIRACNAYGLLIRALEYIAEMNFSAENAHESALDMQRAAKGALKGVTE